MLYSFQADLLYCHVPRTGGVSTATALSITAPDMRRILPQHAPLVEARDELGSAFDEVFKFATVRNPWERLVSWRAFLAKVTCPADTSTDALIDPGASYWRDFEGFLESLAAERFNVAGRSVPAFSQFHQLADEEDNILANRVARFETLSADLKSVLEEASLKVPPLQHKNRSSHGSYRHYYSNTAKEIVERAFPEDIRAFGYTY